jgi:hypothetical protein
MELKQVNETTYIAAPAEPVQFTVYRDGEIDHEYYREQARRERAERLARLGKGTVKAVACAVAVVGQQIAHVAMEVGKDLDMTLYDAQNGTQYRKQYHERKRAEQDQEFAQNLGLTAMQ